MATYIKTLKEDNGDTTYPQTTTDAVLTNSGTTLETELSKYVQAEEIGSTSTITPSITSAMLVDGAVTSDKIASKAVGYDNINFSTFGPVWSTFYLGSATSDKKMTVTTRKGNTIVLGVTNGGCGFFVVSGGENIRAIRQYWGVAFPSMEGKYGLIGVAKGSTIWTRYFSALVKGGSVSAGEAGLTAEGPNSTTGAYYGSLASVGSANKIATNCSFTAEKFGSTAWRFQGTMGSAGVCDCMTFEGECTALSAGSTITPYQRGASESNLTYVNNTLEILEV